MLLAQVAASADLPEYAARDARMKVRSIGSGVRALESHATRFGAQRLRTQCSELVGQRGLKSARADREKRGSGHLTSPVKPSNRIRAAVQRRVGLGATRRHGGTMASTCNNVRRAEARTSGGAFRRFHWTKARSRNSRRSWPQKSSS